MRTDHNEPETEPPASTAAAVDWPAVVRLHGPMVWRTVYLVVGRADDARDCYQEVFLAAVQTARGGPVGNWAAFLRATATRRAIDHLRRRQVRRKRWRFGLFDAGDPVDEHSPPADARVERADFCQRVRTLLTRLPPRQAHAFWMRHMEQMSVPEIAREMDVAPGNVSVLLNRAASHLRRALGATHHHQLGEVTL